MNSVQNFHMDKDQPEIEQTVFSSGFGFEEPEGLKYHFSGHETYPFRYTWLPKGVRNSDGQTDLFVNEDAVVILGVGKNMVRSIRHWCHTLDLLDSPKRGRYKPSKLGNNIFHKNGWDPYLEHPGTLWLLHWKLVKNWSRASTWYLAFTRWNDTEFTRDQLVSWLWHLKESESPSSRGTKSSIKRDVDVFINTYVPSKRSTRQPLEDTFDCPLVELGLIREIGRNTFQFNRGPKPSLPDEIFIYALVEFWNEKAPEQNTMSFEAVMYGAGSPGGAFKFSENKLVERLERLPPWSKLTFGDTAGRRMVLKEERGKLNPMKILSRFYSSNSRGQER